VTALYTRCRESYKVCLVLQASVLNDETAARPALAGSVWSEGCTTGGHAAGFAERLRHERIVQCSRRLALVLWVACAGALNAAAVPTTAVTPEIEDRLSSDVLRPDPSATTIRRLHDQLDRQEERLSKTEEDRSALSQALRDLDLRFASTEASHDTELSRLRSLVVLLGVVLAVALASLIAAWRKVAQLEERWRPVPAHRDTRQLLEQLYGERLEDPAGTLPGDDPQRSS
jgi:hypothetical protein